MMNDKGHVTFFPDWCGDPYITELQAALTDEGWRCGIAGRKKLLFALLGAIAGRRTLHVHWYEGFNPRRSWIGGLAAWMYMPFLWLAGQRGRLVWTVHNLVPHEGYAPLTGEVFVGRLARSCSRIIVHFEETKQSMDEWYGVAEKVVVVPAATYGHAHGPPIERAKARARISSTLIESATLFVQVGSLRSYKQPALVVAGFRDSAPASAMLYVAGPCYEESIKAEIIQAKGNDHRIILRFERLSNEDLVAALCAADWSICPYATSDNPGALNLSVSYGCPVIAPALPQVEKVAAGHAAILYPNDGCIRKRLGEAIESAARVHGRLVGNPGAVAVVSRGDQARQTSGQYLAARNKSRPRR